MLARFVGLKKRADQGLTVNFQKKPGNFMKNAEVVELFVRQPVFMPCLGISRHHSKGE
jgi:hypothetical protein